MEVLSRSPLPVASLLWQPRPSTWVLTFLCKATFRLEVGESPLSDDQEPIHEEDSHWDDDPARSLYAATDLSPHKPRTDVVLVGSAFAPQGQPARVIVARLSVGDMEKSVEVVQDRALAQDGTIAEGSRWSRMPLVYERAAGGPDTWNPVGVRADARDSYGRVKLPNLQPAGYQPKVRGEPIPPTGFGPIPPAWPLRRAKLGRHAASWSSRSILSAPLPEDLDRSFFNAAPPDQQILGLTEDARIVLENLHPQTQRLVTHLPGLKPRATLEGRGGVQPLHIRCDALWIDTDRSICTLTWSGQLPLERRDEPGRVVIALDGAQESDSARGTGAGPHAFESTTMGAVSAQAATALPFVRTTTAVPGMDEPRTPAGTGLPFLPPPSWPAAQPAVPASRPSSPGWPAASAPQPAASQPMTPKPVAVVAQPPPMAPQPIAPPPMASQPIAPPPMAPQQTSSQPVAPPPIQPLPIAPPAARSIGEAAVAMAGTSSARVEPISDALSASNAASGPTNLPGAARRPDDRPSGLSLPTSTVRASPRLDPREVLHLIWYDPDS
ncbi:MAG TPA: DUF2169 domain-containing protein, partial [Candidatus Nanopelagicales bacterium]|nr:DUF2169 domain-containing protein [Candidatus Nanopelagicales bacterium]